MNALKVLLLLGMVVATFAADKSAPVLVWESTEPTAQALPALPAMSNAQLQKHLNSLDSDALVMFIMNELNIEDFSGYPSAFPHLRQEFESSQSAFTPSMPNPAQLPEHLDAYQRVTVDPEHLSSLKLADGAEKTLFLVYVGERAAAERQAALQSTDDLISKVLTQVKSLTGKYSAVLTGKHTTMGGESQRRKARSLKAADDAADDSDMSQFENTGCVFIYTSDQAALRFTAPGADKDSTDTMRVTLGKFDITTAAQTCDNTSTIPNNVVTLTWKNGNSSDGDAHEIKLNTVTLVLNFTARLTGDAETEADDKVSSWTLGSAKLDYSGTVDKTKTLTETQTLDFTDVYAPIEFSYHCTNKMWAMLVKSNATTDVTFSALELPGFQVQAYVPIGADEQFGRAWDCTGFFTIPIWSGLFLSLILLLILIWSLIMLASVPTMDRFDDPRGQPLHVPNAE